MKERVFVCDPVCALPFGHNVIGLKHFAAAAADYFKVVRPLAARALPRPIAYSYGFESEFDFYYTRQFGLSDEFRQFDRRRYLSAALHDPYRQCAIEDIKGIFEKYRIGRDDAIMYPCVDFYGSMAVLDVVEGLAPALAPSIYLRFIGVMEGATTRGEPGLPKLLRKIRACCEHGCRIAVAAETPRYADWLAERLESTVSVVPYPPQHGDVEREIDARRAAKSDDAGLNIVCPGSARIDKGYLALAEIFSAVRRRDPEMSIRFETQALPSPGALEHAAYSNHLYAIPGVRLLPSALTESEMRALYVRADLVLLPYDPSIYELRGSAVFMECICHGIPVMALQGSAFCDQIAYYGGGSVVADRSDFSEAIFAFREKSQKANAARVAQARARYCSDAKSYFAKWVEQ